MHEKLENAKNKVRSRIVKSQAKKEVTSHFKRNKIEYAAAGITAVVMSSYYAGARRRQVARNAEEAKDILRGMARDLNAIALLSVRDVQQREANTRQIQECIRQGRDFEYLPGIGVHIAAPGKPVRNLFDQYFGEKTSQ